MGNLGVPELIVIALFAVLLFGGNRIGETMKGMGQGIREFKKAVREPDEEPKQTEHK